MKKVALLTFHVSGNYGAMLQTYATCKALKMINCDVVLVDLRIEEYIPFLRRFLYFLKNRRFKQFIRSFYPALTKRYNTIEDLRRNPPAADCYIVGSDQTWNPFITKKFMNAFFLDFGSSNTTRIGYSVSFGNDEWMIEDDNINQYLSECVLKFKAISVREKTGISLCEKKFNINPELTLDPTLLFEEYFELTRDLSPKHNIISYKLHEDIKYYILLKEISKRLNSPVEILGKMKPILGFRYVYPKKINDWVKAIAESDFVLTDSYHGLIFSILYKRNFVVFISNIEKSGRIKTLLELLGLENRMCIGEKFNVDIVECILRKAIDFSLVNDRLTKYRNYSWSYLEKSLFDK